MSCRADANASIRALLSSKARGPKGEVLPKRSHLYLWQMGVLYLMCSVFIMIGGMFVLVWSAAGGEEWWDGQIQLAIAFTIISCIAGFAFFWQQFSLLADDRVGERSAGNIRL
jgi:hypothetical protein